MTSHKKQVRSCNCMESFKECYLANFDQDRLVQTHGLWTI